MYLSLLNLTSKLKSKIISNLFDGTFICDGIDCIQNPKYKGKRQLFTLCQIDDYGNHTGVKTQLLFVQKDNDVELQTEAHTVMFKRFENQSLVFSDEFGEYRLLYNV